MAPLSDYNAIHEKVATFHFLFGRVKATIPIEGNSGIVIMLQSTNSNKVTVNIRIYIQTASYS